MRVLLIPFTPRFILLTTALSGTAITSILVVYSQNAINLLDLLLGFFVFFAAVGIYDLVQTRHSVLRNYPIAGHMRFILESIRPEMRQYFFEADKEGAPFSRDKRSIVYQRAKKVGDKRPFGTQYDVYGPRYEWLHHSMAPNEPVKEPFRVTVGGQECKHPYSSSVFNISAMSYGALSANAIRALNRGAKLGGFAHDTGEGGFTPYHREHGGDIIWELGTGYFGCRDKKGAFCPEKFAETAADPQIKMIEVKLSQGAKPGHGGLLPGAKVTREIALIRGVPEGRDCVSPPRHSAFRTPIELMRFIARLRSLSGGKPVGFKLCIGHRWEFLAVVKAMLETQLTPDFIVVDGNEGGTGAAPLEFLDHVGSPLRDGLSFVHSALTGANLRGLTKLGASGKISSAFDMARAMALGADWCNSARGFMFAVGCIQAQACHTDKCPTGVATQDPFRQRALDPTDKAERVASYHRATVEALAELVAAAGLSHPCELRPSHFMHRTQNDDVITFAQLYRFLAPGELIAGTDDPLFREAWKMARADSFQPAKRGGAAKGAKGWAAE